MFFNYIKRQLLNNNFNFSAARSEVFRTILITSLLILFSLQHIVGQTSRYWSLNFASEPSILAGAVVGGYAENQAIYYNPAIISESKTDNIGLSGEIIAFDFYNAKNAFGRTYDLDYFQFDVVPSYVSFFLKSKKQPRLSYQIALLTRDKTDADISESITGAQDIFSELEDMESYSAFYESYMRYQDVWIGGGGAYKISDRFSVGLSTFLSIKKLTDKLTKSLNIYNRNDNDALELHSNRHEISRTDLINYRLQAKVGLQYKLPKCRFGLNITIPSMLIAGKAKRYREFGYNRYASEGIDPISPVLIVDGQDDLPANYKDPFSVALGFNYAPIPDKDMFGISIEYFNEVSIYRMVEAESKVDFYQPTPIENPNVDFMSIWYGARSLINLSVGFRKYINEELTLLGGFRTDFDYLKNVNFEGTSNEYNNFIKFKWNVYHLTGGARFNISRHRFVVGIEYSLAREKDLPPLIDFNPSPDLNNSSLPTALPVNSGVDFNYNGIALFFGFIFNFLDKVE